MLVRELRSLHFIGERRAVQQPKISMLPSVIGYFKEWIRHQLLRAITMRQHPFSTCKKSGLDPLLAEIIHNIALVAGNLIRLLAEIECQRDELYA